MTDDELHELAVARGTGLAALVCLQQLVHVMLARDLLRRSELEALLNEAMAAASSFQADSPLHVDIQDQVRNAIVGAFGPP